MLQLIDSARQTPWCATGTLAGSSGAFLGGAILGLFYVAIRGAHSFLLWLDQFKGKR